MLLPDLGDALISLTEDIPDNVGNGLPTTPTAAYLAAEGISPTTRKEKKAQTEKFDKTDHLKQQKKRLKILSLCVSTWCVQWSAVVPLPNQPTTTNPALVLSTGPCSPRLSTAVHIRCVSHESSRPESAAGDSFSPLLALSAAVDWPSARISFPSKSSLPVSTRSARVPADLLMRISSLTLTVWTRFVSSYKQGVPHVEDSWHSQDRRVCIETCTSRSGASGSGLDPRSLICRVPQTFDVHCSREACRLHTGQRCLLLSHLDRPICIETCNSKNKAFGSCLTSGNLPCRLMLDLFCSEAHRLVTFGLVAPNIVHLGLDLISELDIVHVGRPVPGGL